MFETTSLILIYTRNYWINDSVGLESNRHNSKHRRLSFKIIILYLFTAHLAANSKNINKETSTLRYNISKFKLFNETWIPEPQAPGKWATFVHNFTIIFYIF